jgi:hypothetical protein
MARTKKSRSSPGKYKSKSPCKTPNKQVVSKKKSPKKCEVSKKKSPKKCEVSKKKSPKKCVVSKKKSPKKCVVSKKKSPCKSPRSNSVKFYCLKVRKPVMVMPEDISVAKTKNGRHMLKGWCAEHECWLYKFIKDCDADKMIKKYGKC